MKHDMTFRKKLDCASGIFWLLVSAYVVYRSRQFQLGTTRNPGPGFFFFWGGLLLGLFSLSLVIRTLATPQEHSQIDSLQNQFSNISWMKVIAVLMCLVFYGVLFEKLGFLISTFIFVASLLFLIESKRWYVVIFIAAASTALSYLLFRVWLDAFLPRGILGI